MPLSASIALVPCLAAACIAATSAAEAQVLAEWRFDTAGDAEGWTANGHLADVEVQDGALHGRVIDWDPQFTSPWIEIATAPLQRIEIRMRSDKGGIAQLFWALATEGKYGGFDGSSEVTFHVAGDGEYHDYCLIPFWDRDPTVYRLRIDPPAGATVAIDHVRVVDTGHRDLQPVQPRWEFEAEGDVEDWAAADGSAALKVQGGLLHVKTAHAATLVAPPAEIDPKKVEWVSVRARSNGDGTAAAWWLSPAHQGMGEKGFALIGDSEFHTYNLNVGGVAGWWATPTHFGLELPANVAAAIDWVRIGELPDGPPELAIRALSPVRAINRAYGRPCTIAWEIVNLGGTPARNVRQSAVAPAGLDADRQPPPIASLEFGVPKRVEFHVTPDEPVEGPFSVRAVADNADEVHASTHVAITPRPDVPRSEYVPEPQPAETEYEIGVYYFPGWWDYHRWDPIRRFPERTPVLGWYREGDPQVADWHIKYAVEHGVRFFAYDWYWRDGREDLGHALQALLKARYKSHLKFCFLYANHAPFNIHDRAEFMSITQYWLDNYFMLDEFYKIDGKPVVIIFAPGQLREVLGEPAEVRSALEESRELARKRDLPGIHYMACDAPFRESAQRLKDEGYDAVTAYTYPGAGADGDNRAPYSKMVDGFAEIWDEVIGQGIIKYIVPVAPGWDARPWHGEDTLARPGNTPDEFKRMLTLAKQRIDAQTDEPRNMLIVEAWNEWGEGAICEPELRYGFGQLDAIREVFCPDAGPHVDLCPADVGLPYIEWEEPEPVTRWEFDEPLDSKDWWIGQMENVRVEDGVLVGQTTGGDPSLTGPMFEARARDYSKVVIKMSTSEDTEAQLFWQTGEAEGMGEPRSIHFPVIGGEMREYVLKVGQSPHWRGIITRFRLDPGSQEGMKLELDRIELRK